MPSIKDGPSTSLFVPLLLRGNVALSKLTSVGISDEMSAALEHAPSGDCVCWGIAFQVEDVVATTDQVVSIELSPTVAMAALYAHLRPAVRQAWARRIHFPDARGGAARRTRRRLCNTLR